MDRGAWRATVHGVAKNQARLSAHMHVCACTHTHTHTHKHAPVPYYLIHLCYEGWLGMQRAR